MRASPARRRCGASRGASQMPSSGASWLIRWCLLAAPLDKEEPRTPLGQRSQNAPWTNFRHCEVALFGHHPRSPRHKSGAWSTGCFWTHASPLAPPRSPRRNAGLGRGLSDHGPPPDIYLFAAAASTIAHIHPSVLQAVPERGHAGRLEGWI